MHEILKMLEENPVIGAVRDENSIKRVLESKVGVVFILSASLLNIKSIVDTIKSRGKKVCIHIDLIEGLGKDPGAIDFLEEYIKPDGYITTKVSLVKYAKQKNLFAIHRLFIIDSQSLETGIKSIREAEPDAVEIMPGIAAKMVKGNMNSIKVPLIAGGLISTKEDIYNSLSAGAMAVSTSKMALWNM